MKRNVLITGGSGLLALNWALIARERHSVVLGMHDRMVSLPGTHSVRLDLASDAALERVLGEFAPALVVHAAGLTNVEACEANPALAQHINVDLSRAVGRACAKSGARLAHISTDHLFSDGASSADEQRPVSPTNVYGRTKAEAEQRVLEAYPEALVVRTNFYGWGPSYRPSFSDTILHALRSGATINLFHDVSYNPILCEPLVDTVHELIEHRAAGIFNVVSDDRISKHEFGLRLAAHFGLDAAQIKAVSLADQAGLVRRPLDLSLSNQKACDVLGRKLGGIDEQLQRLLQQEKTGFAREVQAL